MTPELPRALVRWADELALFPADLAESVGDVVVRLASLVGPLERSSRSRAGEPDGVSGLARRGSFDRLLPSEWALLHEAQDEFLRRAASGELSFFEPARREPGRDLRVIALFDAGVAQLGAPRVVHLAVLVLLAARARAAGASFAWGLLQAPPVPIEGLSRSSVHALLRGRVRRAVEPSDARRWAVAVEADDRDRELWVVSGPEAPRVAPFARRVVVDDLLDPERPSAVEVRVEVRDRPRRAAIVDLPDPRTSVRLLRDPFADPAPAAPRVALDAEVKRFVFAPDGRKLWLRSGGSLFTLPIFETDARRALPDPFTPAGDETVVAVGQLRAGTRTWVLLHDPDGFHLCTLTRRGDRVHRRQKVGPAPIDAFGRLAPMMPLANGEAIVPGRVGLVRIGAAHARIELDVPTSAWSIGHGTARVVTDQVQPRLLSVRSDASARVHVDPSRELPEHARGRTFLFGPSGDLFAHARPSHTWTVQHGSTCFEVVLGAGEEAVGVVPRGAGDEPHLVVLDALGRLCAVGARGQDVLHRFEDGIALAQASEHARHVAVLTKRGSFVVLSTESGEKVIAYPGREAT